VHVRPLAAGVDLERAGEVALADLAGKVLEAPHAIGAHQAAGQLVGTAVGEGEADDPVQVLHRLAGELLDLEVDALEADQAGQRAFERRGRVADLDLGVDRKRRGSRRGSRAPGRYALGLERHAAVGAFAGKGEAGVVGGQVGDEAVLAPRVFPAQAPSFDGQQLDEEARSFFLLLGLLFRIQFLRPSASCSSESSRPAGGRPAAPAGRRAAAAR
jgi:hypothetical protein